MECQDNQSHLRKTEVIMNFEIEYIKANNQYFYLVSKRVQDEKCYPGFYKPVCFIKKLPFGRYRIDYWDKYNADLERVSNEYEQIPNTRLILYPSGIQEIRYTKKLN